MNEQRQGQLMKHMSAEVIKSLSERADRGEQSTGVELARTANRALERYFYLLGERRRRLKDNFTQGEMSLLVDACNGIVWWDAHCIKLLPREIEDAIMLNKLDEKWEVDGPALVARLKELDLVALCALMDSVERFWSGPYLKEQPDYSKIPRA